MAHSFLLEEGYWTLEGHWLERNTDPIPLQGRILISWRDDWFTMVTKLIFPQQQRTEIVCQYRGHIDSEARLYTFVLMHSLLGRVEGEGWIAPGSIVQRYWVLGDPQRRTGVETLCCLDSNTYRLSNATMTGHNLTNTMEATLSRHN